MADTDVNGVTHDLSALFSSVERDFLLRNNGDQVQISSLSGKIVGVYFSAHWSGPCCDFTPQLVEVYEEVASKSDFEVVFVSSDRGDEAFNEYFSEMPWLAIPFSDLDARKKLKDLFKVRGTPNLVIIDANGKVSTENGTEIVMEHGVNGYPFTGERIAFLKEHEEAAKRNQTLSSVLVSSSRDYVLAKDGKRVPVSELEGTMVALYIDPCTEFTSVLADMYNALKEKGEKFEVVYVPFNDEEEEFKLQLETMQWLTLPFNDNSCEKLVRYFELQFETSPTLVILGQDGKTVNTNAAEFVEVHGVNAFPFAREKLNEFAEIEKAKEESQTLESLLISGCKDFVIGKGGSKVPVSELVGKTILFYFSAHWCSPCRAFTPQLIEMYNEIKAKDDPFEVIFVSSDSDQSSFEDYYSDMPWLALPYGDERRRILERRFKINGIPKAIAIGPTGRTLTKQAREFIELYGAAAYPFAEEQLKRLEEQEEEMVKGWPEKLKHELHDEHELVLAQRGRYGCDGCEGTGNGWSFYCLECDFDLHPKCALKKSEEEVKQPEGEGYACEGDVCYKV